MSSRSNERRRSRGRFERLLSGIGVGWLRGPRLALGLAPGSVRLLVAAGNGRLEPRHRGEAALAAGAIEPGLRPPNLAEPEAVGSALEGLLGEARRQGALRKRPGLSSLVVPDAAVRMAAVPVEAGDPPKGAEGAEMARWALRDVLPDEEGEVRVDWTLLSGAGDAPAGREAGTGGEGPEPAPPSSGWLLAIGAETEVIREYEVAAGALGSPPGRVVPWTLAVAAAADGLLGADGSGPGEAGTSGGGPSSPGFDSPTPSDLGSGAPGRLVLCGVGERMACLLEEGGVPRFHRAWRGSIREVDVGREIGSLDRYARDKLDLGIAETVICGPPGWADDVAVLCRDRGWRVLGLEVDDALLASLVDR